MEQCGYNWAYFHEIFLLEGFQYNVSQAEFLVSLTKTTHFKPKYICDNLLHPNVAEISCRARIWALPRVIYRSNLLISIERLGVILHNIKENICNFVVIVELYIYFNSYAQTTRTDSLFYLKYLPLCICTLCVIFYTNCLKWKLRRLSVFTELWTNEKLRTDQYGGWSAICMPGNWRQTGIVVRFTVRHTEITKKILAVIAVCAYTVAHDRVNSLLVHCVITIIYPEYASGCEECEVTGSRCLSQQVRRRWLCLYEQRGQIRVLRCERTDICLFCVLFYCMYSISCNTFTYVIALKCSVGNM